MENIQKKWQKKTNLPTGHEVIVQLVVEPKSIVLPDILKLVKFIMKSEHPITNGIRPTVAIVSDRIFRLYERKYDYENVNDQMLVILLVQNRPILVPREFCFIDYFTVYIIFFIS